MPWELSGGRMVGRNTVAASVSGNLSAPLHVVEGSISGASKNAGDTSAPLPKLTGSITGASVGTSKVDPATTGGVQPVGLTGWTLQLSEEFGGTISTVNSTNGWIKFRADGPTWGTWYPGTASMPDPHTNNPGTELEYYDPSGVTLSGGNAVLTATLDNVHSGLPYTSGMIQSNPSHNQQRGFFEARMTCPGTAGSWPAFWMIPASYNWPPEFDIMENFGTTSTYKVSNWGNNSTVFDNTINVTDATAMHTYGLKWTTTQAVWYRDGTVVATENTASSLPPEPMYVVLNMAVRSQDFSSYVSTIEYVRVWS